MSTSDELTDVENTIGQAVDSIVGSIGDAFVTASRNGETVNTADAIIELSDTMHRIANAITPGDAGGNNDATGGHVRSLTEAVMGMTAGLVMIAEAINRLADAHTRD